jgi:hypothetical protein
MKSALVSLVLVLGLGVAGLWAQRSNGQSASGPSAGVPRLVKFSGVVTDLTRKPLSGPVEVTFNIYQNEADAESLWQETQTVEADAGGRYTVLLGATSAQGLPMELFTSGEARWLGVAAGKLPEQPRVLLVSVPYALEAGDAATLGGKPASAYLLAQPSEGSASGGSQTGGATTAGAAVALARSGPVAAVATPLAVGGASSGSMNYLAKWVDSSNDLGNSLMFDNGTNVGIGTTTPGSLNGNYFPSLLLQAAQAGASTYLTADTELGGGYAGVLLNRGAATANNRLWAVENQPSAGNSSSQFAISTYRDAGIPTALLTILRSGNVGIGTSSPAANLEVNGTTKFDGLVTFASGQTFPGGTITGGEAVQGNVSSSGQLISTVAQGTAPLQVTSTTQVANLNASLLGGIAASAFATVGANAFTGNQTISGNGINLTIGDVGCGSTTAGIAVNGAVCFNAALFGDGTNTVINRPGGGNISFREGNGPDEMTVLGNGSGVTLNASATNAVALSVEATDTASQNTGLSGIGDGPDATGVVGIAQNGTGAYGVWGQSKTGIAGQFDGNVQIIGNLSKSGGSFKIDHPLDPGNKYLYHSFVESPDMMNIYNGNAVLDADGQAVVQLPDWFEALNGDFRYQLTAIGGPGPNLYIAEKVHNNSFKIAGGAPGLEVSWQVTGIRQDAWANAHRIPVEVEKPEKEKGYYLHPELFGASEEKGIEWANRRATMKRLKERTQGRSGAARP